MFTMYIIDVFPTDGWKSVRTFEVRTREEMESTVDFIKETFDMEKFSFDIIRETTP